MSEKTPPKRTLPESLKKLLRASDSSAPPAKDQERFNIDGAHITDSAKDGIHISGRKGGSIRNVRIERSGRNGITIGRSDED